MSLTVFRSMWVACLLCGAAAPTKAAAPVSEDVSSEAFAVLKKDVELLRKDEERRQFRHHYEKLIVKLQSLALADTAGSKSDDAAFVAAQLLEELYFVSRVDVDKAAAETAFVSCADRFPKSNLADDALVAAARLSSDPKLQRKLLERVVAMGDRADLRSVAEQKLATLPKLDKLERADGKSKLDNAIAKLEPKRESKVESKAEAKADTRADTEASAAKPETKLDTQAQSKPGPAMAVKLDDRPDVRADAKDEAKRLVTATRAERNVEVLPEPPPAGTPSRKIVVIKHDKTSAESVVMLRVSGPVGVVRGDVPHDDATPKDGRRIFYDLTPAKLGQRNISPIEVHDGVIARVRAGQYDTDVVRLVIELEGTHEPALRVSRHPFELTLSVPLAQTGQALASARPVIDAAAVKKRFEQGTPGGVSISQQLGLAVHRVVIDAGHGGNDTGAVGPSGVKEKDLTLQIAKRVRGSLLAEIPGIEVIMTRDDDSTLALQDRTNTANASGADLFISIHCNASPFRRVRGVETYTLNITHDKYAMKLAARENAEMGEGSISDLDFILADLAMKSNVDDSVRLGGSVQRAMMKSLRNRWTDVPDLGLKHALFYVLMGNRMPSILVETSFVSNKVEEQRLSTDLYQQSIADGVVQGVRQFIEERQAFYQP